MVWVWFRYHWTRLRKGIRAESNYHTVCSVISVSTWCNFNKGIPSRWQHDIGNICTSMTTNAKNHTMFPCGKTSQQIKLNGKFLMTIFQLCFILMTDFTIFFVPNKAIRWHFANVSLMFTIPSFSVFSWIWCYKSSCT